QVSQLEDAKAQYREAEISFEAARLALERCFLRSRFDGTILKQYIESRTSVSPGEPIYVFQSDAEPWVTKVELIDKNALMMASGATAKVNFAPYPGQTLAGWVSRVAHVANPKDGLYTAEVTITPEGLTLWPGMVAELELKKQSDHEYYVVPLDALLDLKGTRGKIYLVSGDQSHAIEKIVTLNGVHHEFVSLLDDLSGYRSVITHGHHGLKDQNPIKIFE
ncbi:MAG: HlyD family efflux transporter periplasmic adaptor subunit, partial [Gammaproteobacteria bacterium]|nr:HlyD family efflux transporter periplasmic adaptor subunit [Gammaproteobacteria bacterium]